MTAVPALMLASSSPRRRELLAQLGIEFTIQVAAPIDESPRPGEAPAALVERLARAKAEAGARMVPAAAWVLGVDTEVALDGRVFGKPRDAATGIEMLRELAGRTHEVLSAVALVGGGRTVVALSRSRVRFRPITAAEARDYWASGEPADKAGGYAIQGRGAAFVERLEGSYTGVVGLPVFETLALLREVKGIGRTR